MGDRSSTTKLRSPFILHNAIDPSSPNSLAIALRPSKSDRSSPATAIALTPLHQNAIALALQKCDRPSSLTRLTIASFHQNAISVQYNGKRRNREIKLSQIEQEIVVYETQSGKLPFWDWLMGLKDVKGRSIIQARIERVRLGNFGDCRTVGEGVQELRIKFGPGYRVYFGRDGQRLVILLCGGDKSRQQKDIVAAKALWKEYQNAD